MKYRTEDSLKYSRNNGKLGAEEEECSKGEQEEMAAGETTSKRTAQE